MNLKFCTYLYAWFLELGVSKLSNRFSDAFLFNTAPKFAKFTPIQAAQRNGHDGIKTF